MKINLLKSQINFEYVRTFDAFSTVSMKISPIIYIIIIGKYHLLRMAIYPVFSSWKYHLLRMAIYP